jgi:ferredoxin-NADP reductase
MPPPPTFETRLVGARTLSPSVREIELERADGAPFVFEAGQWVTLVLAGPEGELRRSYSIASGPDGTPRFRIAVTHVANGPGSTILHAAQPGAHFTAIGPQGFFTRPLAEATPSLFVATGTGLTPFHSMVRAAVAAGDTTPIGILLGVRHEDDVLYGDELRALAKQHAHLRFDVTLSRPGEGWTGRRGYVQEHVRGLLEELDARVAGTGRESHVFVCGLQRMVGAVRELLKKEMGLPRQRVRTERYD